MSMGVPRMQRSVLHDALLIRAHEIARSWVPGLRSSVPRCIAPGTREAAHTPILHLPLISGARCSYLAPTISGANDAMGPLQGIKVIDMTTVLMGPYATQMLGDYGADVIKVESLDGDVTRLIGPTRHPGMGPVFLNTNRNKRSICLDLKKPAGRDAVLRLVETSDVLIYNVRPQAMMRLDLGYDVVSKRNPRLIYAGVFGFGQDGPYAAKPAYDDLIQGATGLPALMAQTSDGIPRYVPNALVDRIVGLTAVGAVCASLVHRERTGRGQRVDIPMFETMAGFVMGDHMGGLTYEPPLDKGGYARHLSRDRRPYKTSDGYLSVIVYNDKQWESFFKATGRNDLRRDPRFATFAGRPAISTSSMASSRASSRHVRPPTGWNC